MNHIQLSRNFPSLQVFKCGNDWCTERAREGMFRYMIEHADWSVSTLLSRNARITHFQDTG